MPAERAMGLVMVVAGLAAYFSLVQAVQAQTIKVDPTFPRGKLKITVGEPTVMAPKPGHTQGVLATSRTGLVAAFYQSGGSYAYRVSQDRGRTWSEQMPYPTDIAEGAMFTALRDGGVLKMMGEAKPVKEGDNEHLQAKRVLFSDDFLKYEVGTSAVSLPNAVMHTKWAKFYPSFDKGKITQLANGDLLATMYGNLKGDTKYRTIAVRSTDQGQTWQYLATVAYDPNDPNPELPGDYCGYCEPSLALLPGGTLLCMMRTEGATEPYRPMYTSWSDDMGKTWSKPTPTQPHLKNVWPTLAVLDNDVVACIYGRPGVHVVFSTDNGHTWTDRVTFTNLTTVWDKMDRPDGWISGYADIVKIGPSKLLAITTVGYPGGTQVFPITVERAE